MSIETEEADKKNNNNQPGPVAEAILDVGSANAGDNTVEADTFIRSFIGNRLEEFHTQVEGAIDTMELWVQSQSDDARQSFDSYGFFGYLGDRFIGELQMLAGGAGAPLMDVIAREVYNTVSWAQHAEFDAGGFMYHMRRGIRDACWFVRDNAAAVLEGQWPQLLKLAAEGSTDFIAPLLQLGLPTINFNPAEFGDRMIGHAQGYRDAHAPAKEAVAADQAQKAPEQEQEAKQAAVEEQKALQQDESQKQQLAI